MSDIVDRLFEMTEQTMKALNLPPSDEAIFEEIQEIIMGNPIIKIHDPIDKVAPYVMIELAKLRMSRGTK